MADLIEMKPSQSTMLKRVYYHGTKLVAVQPKKSKRANESIGSKYDIQLPFEVGYRAPSLIQL